MIVLVWPLPIVVQEELLGEAPTLHDMLS